MNDVLNLDIFRFVAAYVFVILLLIIVRVKGISREKEIIIASLRMTIQLILVGYVLIYLFNNIRPANIFIILAVMEAFAINNIFRRSKRILSKKLKIVIALSMIAGTLTSLLYFIFVVMNVSPWYDPKSFIPIAGMLIGNSMTGINLGVNSLVEGMHSKKDLIDAALMLGSNSKTATKEVVDHAFDSAIIPTINSMLGMGIVFLPGMMTGQILSGLSPLIATQYQIVIMLGILGSVSFSVVLLVEFGYKTFFNNKEQFIIDEDKK